MGTNRYVTYIPHSGSYTGTHIQLFPAIAGNYVVTRVRVTAKFSFASSAAAGYFIVGQWGHCISLGLNGATPPNWMGSPSDSTIVAFDNAEPDGLERIFLTTTASPAVILISFTRTLEWRGQFHIGANTVTYFYFGNAWGAVLPDFSIDLACQLWYAD
jgi:hypothetical protein